MQPPARLDAAAARRLVEQLTRPRASALCPEIVLAQADELTRLWQATESRLGELGLDIPFWSVAWPGGEALARYLLDDPAPVRARRVLDLGTGCGICAIAAARAGAARVRGADPDPLSHAAVALNAARNRVEVDCALADPLASDPPRNVDVILAADLWYERWLARRVTPWLREAAARGISVIGADPGRAYLPREGLETLARYAVPTSLDLERDTITRTRVFRVLPRA
jgi:predicted nicotinamide N-methyase